MIVILVGRLVGLWMFEKCGKKLLNLFNNSDHEPT